MLYFIQNTIFWILLVRKSFAAGNKETICSRKRFVVGKFGDRKRSVAGNVFVGNDLCKH